MKEGSFTDEELESARRSIVSQYQSLGDLQSSLSQWYLGQSLESTQTPPEQAADEIQSVTREQIIGAAQSVKPGLVYLLAGEEDV
ncbi:hypothetical protein SDC9_199668 [bioreactor metagenome]|uniref:Peptidase M16 C-terminal domain-containing protein n=1 Tax=bioreactor metagenome TaxID=1076179 RepID=A0A645ILV2_9ZZZZ